MPLPPGGRDGSGFGDVWGASSREVVRHVAQQFFWQRAGALLVERLGDSSGGSLPGLSRAFAGIRPSSLVMIWHSAVAREVPGAHRETSHWLVANDRERK